MITECNHDAIFKICNMCSILNQREMLAEALLLSHNNVQRVERCDCHVCELSRNILKEPSSLRLVKHG